MEKYGVEEDQDKTKTASADVVCPDCGRELEDAHTTGGLLICIHCGTKPFEKENVNESNKK